MTATNYFFSTQVAAGADRPYTASGSGAAGSLNQGTSSDATDYFELRIMTDTNGDGAHPTNITKRDVENFLALCHRWLHDQGSGLDYLISANSGTEGVP